MTDLTLNDYKDLSKEELGPILEKESRRMFHADDFETDDREAFNGVQTLFQQKTMNKEDILPFWRRRIADYINSRVTETLFNLARIGFQIASRMYVHLFYRAS